MKNSTLKRCCFGGAFVLLISLLHFSADATYKEGYYAAMDGKKKEALKTAAKQCVQSHTTLYYYNLPNQWQYTDVYPELVDGLKRWWDMYSDNVYLIQSGMSGTSSFSANKMQREHAVPKSWWKNNGSVEYTPAYSDMWNLYPSDGPANQAKLNYPLGPVSGKPSFDNGVTKVGTVTNGYGGGSGMVFEPGDEYKGDFARAFFYMATVYNDLPWVYNYMFVQETWPSLKPWAYNMLLQWARMDPVSQKEIERNDKVELYQHNRNPFVDFPELAEYIWGTRTSETFYISEQGGQVTPPITGDPEITAPSQGESLDFGQAAVGGEVVVYLEIEGKNFISPLSVSVSGSAKSMFIPEASSINASALNTTSSYLLPIVFRPTAIGRQEAKLLLYDGGMNGSVSINLIGEGCEVPELSRPLATDATNVTDTSYEANWQAIPEVADYYIVTRVKYLENGAEGEMLDAPGTSLLIEGRDPTVDESYTVQASRLGYLSESSNSILVAASGVETVCSDLPIVLGSVQGGFNVISNPSAADITVYNVAGELVKVVNAPAEGDMIFLSSGVYIVTSKALGKPVKFVII